MIVLHDYGKVIVSVTVVLCVTQLVAFDKLDAELGAGIIGAIVAYTLGNGVAAVRRHASSPMISARPPERDDVVLTPSGPHQLVPLPKHLADEPPVDDERTSSAAGFRVPGRHAVAPDDPTPPVLGGPNVPGSVTVWEPDR